MKAFSESGADRYRRSLTRPGFAFLTIDRDDGAPFDHWAGAAPGEAPPPGPVAADRAAAGPRGLP
jgi:hypothetical protein